MISVASAVTFGARVVGFPTGLTGTVGVRILDNIGGTTLARTTAGISESPASSGSYIVALTSPASAGEYAVLWDTGAVGPSTTASTPLLVASTLLQGETIALSAPFETTVEAMPTGLAGTIGVRVINDATGATVVARTTAGIAEFPAGSGFYTATLTAPAVAGQYSAFWDTGVVSPTTTAAENLTVATTATVASGIDLCTLADVREFLELPTSDTSRDVRIQTSITQASEHIINDVKLELAPATADQARAFLVDPRKQVDGQVLLRLLPNVLRSVTTLKLHPEEASLTTTLDANTDYMLRPLEPSDGVYTDVRFLNGLSYGSTFYSGFDFCKAEIRGAWGYANVPTDVRNACIETVASWLRRDVAAFNIDEIDDPRQLAPNPALVYSIPPSALKKLRPYRRLTMAF